MVGKNKLMPYKIHWMDSMLYLLPRVIIGLHAFNLMLNLIILNSELLLVKITWFHFVKLFKNQLKYKSSDKMVDIHGLPLLRIVLLYMSYVRLYI